MKTKSLQLEFDKGANEMSSIAVLGCIWGDEAKAKIVDVLAENAEIVVRFQGGNNAGHTINLNGKKYVFHLVPAGILYPDKMCALAAGVVIDPFDLIQEINNLKKKGISFEGRFFLDPRTSIVLPLHKYLDVKAENGSRQTKIGTTKKGIGPCYSDKIARTGICFSDLFDQEYLTNRLENIYSSHRLPVTEIKPLLADLMKTGEELKPFLKQLSYFLNELYGQNKNILFEGAQGSLLDIYFGTYPFVTSSHTIAGGISVGCGFSPKKIDRIVGVYKSYFTRVGEGPFPTELTDETGEKIRIRGNEFGATTGRPRRCGWFDVVAAKYTAMINGIDEIALTLLDVLSGFETIKVCTKYLSGNEKTEEFPFNAKIMEEIQPEYIELPGWKEDITEVKNYEQLPINAKKYISKIEELLNKKISIISVGPERRQTIIMD